MAIALSILVLLVGLNVWATRRVLRSDVDGHRKKRFVASVWIVPFLGALVVKHVSAPVPTPLPLSDEDAEVASLQVERIAGPPFDLRSCIVLANGVPVFDAQAFDVEVAALPQEERDHLRSAAGRAWLLHVRDALGAGFHLRETADCLLVSSLDAPSASALLRYVSTTRNRITRLLEGVASFDPAQKSVLIVFDDESSYYHYVATFYPEEGEFAFSGGMFIPSAVPHFCARRADLLAVEPVIAHELTHSALSGLELPLWLDEGIAVNTERRLSTPLPSIHTASELHEKHLRFWDAARVQEFWSGKSFQRTDDGNLLSYELARILVEEMSRNWSSFASFVRAASREDAGSAAASSVLDIDLGASVKALFGDGSPANWSPDPSAWDGPARTAATETSA